jgi:hypothetical protein
MKDKYTITQDQLNEIRNLKTQIEIYADILKSICEDERNDVKWIGFKLGQLHNDIRRDFVSTIELLYSINSENV